jgi:hypothetical protein
MASEERLLERCGRPSSVFFSVSSMSFEADIFAQMVGSQENKSVAVEKTLSPSNHQISTSRFFSKNEPSASTLLLYM